MRIVNTKTWLYKDINLNDYSVYELNEIYEFYIHHDNFAIVIEGEIQ